MRARATRPTPAVAQFLILVADSITVWKPLARVRGDGDGRAGCHHRDNGVPSLVAPWRGLWSVLLGDGSVSPSLLAFLLHAMCKAAFLQTSDRRLLWSSPPSMSGYSRLPQPWFRYSPILGSRTVTWRRRGPRDSVRMTSC